eukprot:TRINITY_DN47006_c0_g1_i1.p1 TRINITY_DN47006_c0_g1~~TRINITY_DN47006_c0_g1_i1.p1  ORF type:complete len:1494 (+),score=308.88 TRINITY_DN47006_c0_g1_i1:122-4603(+)
MPPCRCFWDAIGGLRNRCRGRYEENERGVGDNRRRALMLAEELGVLTPQQRQSAEMRLDGEQVVWLTKLAEYLWPRARDPTSAIVKAKLQERIGTTWEVDRVDLGSAVPEFGPVTALVVDGGVVLAIGVSYQPLRHQGMKIDVGPVGLRDTSVYGTLLLRLVPLIHEAPFVGGLGVAFANSPEINFVYTGIQVPILPGLLRDAIVDAVNDNMVAPHFHCINFAPEYTDTSRLQSPDPIGVIFLNVISATKLGSGRTSCMYSSISPYVEVRLGATRWCTDEPHGSTRAMPKLMHQGKVAWVRGANPTWDNAHYFVVHSLEQWVMFNVYDMRSGDLLGQARWPVGNLAGDDGVKLTDITLTIDGGVRAGTVLRVAGGWFRVSAQQPRIEDDVCLVSVQVDAVTHIPENTMRSYGPFTVRARCIPAESATRRGWRIPGFSRRRQVLHDQIVTSSPPQNQQDKEEPGQQPDRAAPQGPVYNQVLHVPGSRVGRLVVELIAKSGRCVARTERIELGPITGESPLGSRDPFAPTGELLEVEKKSVFRRKRKSSLKQVCGQVTGSVTLQRLARCSVRRGYDRGDTGDMEPFGPEDLSADSRTGVSEDDEYMRSGVHARSIGTDKASPQMRSASPSPIDANRSPRRYSVAFADKPVPVADEEETDGIDTSQALKELAADQRAALYQCITSGALTWETYEELRKLTESGTDLSPESGLPCGEPGRGHGDSLAWANVLFEEIWPLARTRIQTKIQEHVNRVVPWHINRISRRTKFGPLLRALKVTSQVNLGEEVPRFGTIRTHRVPHGAELMFDVSLNLTGGAGGGLRFWGTLAGFTSAQVQLRNIRLKGLMVVAFRSFTSEFPFFASIDVGFLDTPDLTFDLSGSLFMFPVHRIIPAQLLQRAIFGEVVLPARLNFSLYQSDEIGTREAARLAAGRRPQGMFRICAWGADGLPPSRSRVSATAASLAMAGVFGRQTGIYLQASCGSDVLRTQPVDDDDMLWQVLSPELDLLVHHDDQRVILGVHDFDYLASRECLGIADLHCDCDDSDSAAGSPTLPPNMSFAQRGPNVHRRSGTRLFDGRGIPAWKLRKAVVDNGGQLTLPLARDRRIVNADITTPGEEGEFNFPSRSFAGGAGSPNVQRSFARRFTPYDGQEPPQLRLTAQWLQPPTNPTEARGVSRFLLSVTFFRVTGSICGGGPNFAHQYKVAFVATTRGQESAVSDLCRPPRRADAGWFEFDMDITKHVVVRAKQPPNIRIVLYRLGQPAGEQRLFRGFEGEHAGPFHVLQHRTRICTVHAAMQLLRLSATHAVQAGAPQPPASTASPQAAPSRERERGVTFRSPTSPAGSPMSRGSVTPPDLATPRSLGGDGAGIPFGRLGSRRKTIVGTCAQIRTPGHPVAGEDSDDDPFPERSFTVASAGANIAQWLKGGSSGWFSRNAGEAQCCRRCGTGRMRPMDPDLRQVLADAGTICGSCGAGFLATADGVLCCGACQYRICPTCAAAQK